MLSPIVTYLHELFEFSYVYENTLQGVATGRPLAFIALGTDYSQVEATLRGVGDHIYALNVQNNDNYCNIM